MKSFIALYTIPWIVLCFVSLGGMVSLVRGNTPVPVSLRVLVKRCKHDWQNDVDVITNKVAEVFVVPEIERTFSDLYHS